MRKIIIENILTNNLIVTQKSKFEYELNYDVDVDENKKQI